MTGHTNGCYKLTYISSNVSTSETVTSSNTIIALDPVAYETGETIYIKVEKMCGTEVREAGRYRVQYHF